jgi:uncharacterized protein
MTYSLPPFTVTVWFVLNEETSGLEAELIQAAGVDPYSSFDYQGMRDMHWGAQTEADARQIAERLLLYAESPHVVLLNLRGDPKHFEAVTYKDDRPVLQQKETKKKTSAQSTGAGIELEDLFRPLTKEEFDELNDFLLSDATPEECMEVSSLDGFLTALVVGPETIPPSQWLPLVWGETEDDEMVWESQDHAQRILGLVMRLMNDISAGLQKSPPQISPLFYTRELEDREISIIDEWCYGFMRGVRMSMHQWEPFLQSEEATKFLPVLLHGTEEGWKRLESEAYLSEIPHEQWVDGIEPAVLAAHGYWKKRRATPTRRAARVSRNDPCPCGSGKKFKKCCLNVGPVH